MAGVLIAIWSAASGVAGLVYGAHPAVPRWRVCICASRCPFPLGCAVLFAATSPATMAVLVVLAGIPIAPLIASRNQLVERVAPPGTATEAFTWPLTALVAGVAFGAATGGALVESYSWTAGVLSAVTVSVAGALLLLLRRETIVPAAAAA